MQSRLNRLFAHDQRCFDVAIDHGVCNEPSFMVGLEDMTGVVDQLIAAPKLDAGAAAGVAGPAPLTPEALVAAAPEVIVLPEAGLAALGGMEAFNELPGVADTPAAQNGRLLAYDEAFFFNLGPRVAQALDRFISDLYPDLTG